MEQRLELTHAEELEIEAGGLPVVPFEEFPDDESAAAFALAIDRGGQFRSETMRAFDVPEFVEIREAVREAEF